MRQSYNLILRNWKIRLWLALALTLALIAAGALAQDLIFDCAQLDQFIREGATIFPAEREWYDRNCVEEEEEDIVWPPLPTPTPRPPIDTCAQLPADIIVSGYQIFSTQCQRLSAAGVGNEALIAQGILDALDLWANVEGEMRVCFRMQGRLKFLDAATAPRLVSDLAAEYVDGMTCGRINRVGTVVLLPGGAPAPETAVETSGGESLLEATGSGSTTNCELETNARLSLRMGPSVYYSRLLSMPEGSKLVARARIGDWYMVNFKGQWGWSSGEHMTASPGCDALDDERAVILPPVVETPAPALADCQLTAVSIINLRAGPGLDYEVLAEIPYQATLGAAAESDDWFKVEYMSQTGWVSREYVFRRGDCHALGEAGAMMPPSAMEAEADETEMTVPGARPLAHCNLRSGDIINLRQGPGLDYAVIAEIPNETNLMPTARTSDWFKVAYEAAAGWVHIDYVFRNGACG